MNVSNGLSPVTPDDQAGKLWIVTILSLIYALHVAGARAFIKRHMFGLDDALFGVATVSTSPLCTRHSSLSGDSSCILVNQ